MKPGDEVFINIGNELRELRKGDMGIDQTITADLSQMELYLALGKLVSSRPKKGAAVIAAEYITSNYPDQIGFSPHNLRRMRDTFRIYEEYPEMLEQAVKVGWALNVVIMEADLDMDARYWYLLAVQRFGWTKAELIKQIAAGGHTRSDFEEETQSKENLNPSKKLSFAAKTIWRIITQTVDFLDRLWYNKPWKLSTFQQMGITGGTYG